MLTHYAGLGDTRSTCGLPLPRAPEEDSPDVEVRLATDIWWPVDGGLHFWSLLCVTHRDKTSIDPCHVDCPDCVRGLPEVHACGCGAPALYGANAVMDAQYCAEHTPEQLCRYRCAASQTSGLSACFHIESKQKQRACVDAVRREFERCKKGCGR